MRGGSGRTAASRPPARRHSGLWAPEPLVIASSDSGEDVECVTPFSQTRVRSQQNPRPRPRAKPADSTQTPGDAPRLLPSPRRVRAPQPMVLDLDDGDDDDSDFAEPQALLRSSRAHSACAGTGHGSGAKFATRANSWATPAPKRARTQPQHPSSSPPLLRASSPTVARVNRDCLAATVLARCTQDVHSAALPPSSPPSGAMLSGSTAVGSAAAPGGLLDCIPETPPGSPSGSPLDSPPGTPLASLLESPTAGSPARTADGVDLSSDPISEFCTPTVSPARFRIPIRNTRQPGQHGGQAQQHRSTVSGPADQPSDDPGSTSITQWYHSNLAKNSEPDSEPNSQLSLQLSSGEDSLACGGGSSASAQPGVEPAGGDGYSSPLEGFWDLRNAMQGCTQDRDMYVRQFELTDRQRVNRARKVARRAPAALSPPPGISPPRPVGRTGTQGRSGRGRGVRTRPARGGKGSRQRRGGSGSIRPVSSQRAPAPRAAVPPPVAYNHYADDPFLDVAGSMNWEGGGISRFG